MTPLDFGHWFCDICVVVAVFAALLAVWWDRVEKRQQAARQAIEQAARERVGLPPGYPEMLTAELGRADERFLAALDRELDPEVAE